MGKLSLPKRQRAAVAPNLPTEHAILHNTPALGGADAPPALLTNEAIIAVPLVVHQPEPTAANQLHSPTSSALAGWESDSAGSPQPSSSNENTRHLNQEAPASVQGTHSAGTPSSQDLSQPILSELYDVIDDVMPYDDYDYDYEGGIATNGELSDLNNGNQEDSGHSDSKDGHNLESDDDDGTKTDLDDEELEIQDLQQQKLEQNEDAEPICVADVDVPQEVPAHQEQHKACKVCGVDISSMHYLQQVAHVKQCMAGRGGGRGCRGQLATAGAIKTKAGPEGGRGGGGSHGPVTSVLSFPCTNLLAMDIRDWLKALDLEQYIETFITEEIDMSIVHALTDDDLRSIGLTSGSHRRKIIEAARLVKAEILAAQRAKQRPTPAPRLVQQQLKLPFNTAAADGGVGSSFGAVNEGMPTYMSIDKANGELQQQQQQQQMNASRFLELALLTSLYPSAPTITTATEAAVVGLSEAAVGPSKDANNSNGPVQLKEQTGNEQQQQHQQHFGLPSIPETTRAPVPARVAAHKGLATLITPSKSLWTSAAECREVTVGLDARLSNKRKPQQTQYHHQGQQQQQQEDRQEEEGLHRGGINYAPPAHQESRGVKMMKLAALKQELNNYEATIEQLRGMVKELERDLGLCNDNSSSIK